MKALNRTTRSLVWKGWSVICFLGGWFGGLFFINSNFFVGFAFPHISVPFLFRPDQSRAHLFKAAQQIKNREPIASTKHSLHSNLAGNLFLLSKFLCA